MADLNVTERIADDLPLATAAGVADDFPASATVGVSGFGSVGYPKAVPEAIAQSSRDFGLTIASGGSVGKEIDTDLVEAGAVERRFPYQSRSASRAAANSGELAYHDRHISRFSDEVEFGRTADLDVAVVEAVAVGHDWLIPSTSLGHTAAFVDSADRLIVEINESQPLALQQLHDIYRRNAPPHREPLPLRSPGGRIGSSEISFDSGKLEAVVRTNRRDTPYVFRDPSDTDRKIASNLADFLATEVEHNPVLSEVINLQFGVGSLGNALMGAIANTDFGSREVNYFGEVIQDGLLDMLDEGKLNVASATSLAFSEEGQERFFENIDQYLEDVVLRPASISNNPTLADRFGIVAVNSALEIDIYGHVNSTHVNGSKAINGIGGSGDFNRNAAVPIVALPSTAKGGDLSRVVPMVPHVDHTEHDISVVVTEQGVADLRGKSPRERAKLLIQNCAHPSFRDDLTEYFEDARAEGGHIPHDLDQVFDWQN
ncbi:acetyl-CoA hydrolase/transferase C-terminal domain-containing protein [Haloferax profundi]|uniref:Acetyl-CoA hydrolase n=1 Tax=Haloferax profundi TaxID=1544718 RepID=A0A0W1RGG9_9EURY|nr:acetyl-CoA hydrolase/transferase C-terminal domain-containing protein [Haloferax profundi]KTG12222.1 acetyl-CoA hydrolase [Haloferax profundi]